jgi:hypothetical protein
VVSIAGLTERYGVPVALLAIAASIFVASYQLNARGEAANAKSIAISSPAAVDTNAAVVKLPATLDAHWRTTYKAGIGEAQGSLDTIKIGEKPEQIVAGHEASIVLPRAETISIRGWAVGSPKKLAAGVFVELGDGVPIVAHYGYPRADVAQALGDSSLIASGYVATTSAQSLQPRTYDVRVFVVEPQGRRYLPLAQGATRVHVIVQ